LDSVEWSPASVGERCVMDEISEGELGEIERCASLASPAPWEAFIEGRDQSSGDTFIRVGGVDASPPDIYVQFSMRLHRTSPTGRSSSRSGDQTAKKADRIGERHDCGCGPCITAPANCMAWWGGRSRSAEGCRRGALRDRSGSPGYWMRGLAEPGPGRVFVGGPDKVSD
jgi:hypothetical protein